ncbi:hypothetical protein ACQCX5_08420 [Propionibacteriaceae bacterium G57]|uniref:hypothetical protein n=1 Tax=Aestuariimicrobium sp. G57 TaxID=3418485 RepID=UPI003DA70B0E
MVNRTAPAETSTPDAWVWIGRNGVQVQVPASWGYEAGDTCQQGVTTEPKVALGPDRTAVVLTACTRGAAGPSADQGPRVEFLGPRDDLPGAWATQPKTMVGDYGVLVSWGAAYAADHPDITQVAARILSSVTSFGAGPDNSPDHNGCPLRPQQQLGALADIASSDHVSICQYRAEPDGLSLWSSRQLEGKSAKDFAKQLNRMGTQPLPHAEGCEESDLAMRVMLHVTSPSGPRVFRVNYTGCQDDAGLVTSQGSRGMSAAVCRQIFTGPTAPGDMSSVMAARCGLPVAPAQPTTR